MLLPRRFYGSIVSNILSKSKKNNILKSTSLLNKDKYDIHPREAAITRFAPSPTGMLHLGSLRTALYNYLLAKNTGGKFILRVEDTDRTRLKEGAETNIYESLKWCGLEWDEGPFLQSDRTELYRKYIKHLLAEKKAYRCFCTKDRLDGLRESAMKLVPPTNVSYDRCCEKLSEEEIQKKLNDNIAYTIRFKAPDMYPPFEDLLHGQVNLQPQQNPSDIRYDDPILMKSDNFPTYHLANVIDDHLMKITHVIRGEEWLPSTPKHIALYEAFGWAAPKFIHLPLLTTVGDKKLSKRKGDMSVLSLKSDGVLPEALINFSALFGWSPPRELASKNHECFTKEELIKLFNVNGLTKGNAKVDIKKLWFFNKHFLQQKLRDPSYIESCKGRITESIKHRYGDVAGVESKVLTILTENSKALSNINEFVDVFYYFFEEPDLSDRNQDALAFRESYDAPEISEILNRARNILEKENDIDANVLVKILATDTPKKIIFQTLRYALAGAHPGASVPVLLKVLGGHESLKRIENATRSL
ncbi:Glutamate--tRNA ligase, mitochondrial [Nakaseomyces bracarensis]|uniref:glutamate--tRNA ligase n=1 Tax=Nakaseomyces bracarensis TaxID=273131 RepID=A0ABR4NZ81_9SACH